MPPQLGIEPGNHLFYLCWNFFIMLVKCSSSVNNHSWSKFMSVIAMPCPYDSILQCSTPPQTPAYMLSASSSMLSPKFWWGGIRGNKDDQI